MGTLFLSNDNLLSFDDFRVQETAACRLVRPRHELAEHRQSV